MSIVTPFDSTVPPTKVGQLVRFLGYGGNVRQWHAEARTTGTVVRFTRAGNPVIRLEGSQVSAMTGKNVVEIVDTLGCARRVTHDGTRWIRP